MTYTHLAQEERYQIYALRLQGISIARIGAALQRNRSTISRELKHNAQPLAGYKPTWARAIARKCQCD